LEAMAMGKPIIASPQALEGLRVQPGVHAHSASTPAQWLECMTHLLSNANARTSCTVMARCLVARNYCWQTCLEAFPLQLAGNSVRTLPEQSVGSVSNAALVTS
jgi:polysaccharide biosynthesis protein PslH